jgi:hypothetical protein
MNSLLERKVRDLKKRVMSMLLHSTLPASFWWMAWKTACYLQNRMPTVTVYGYMTPFECVRGIPPSLKRLRIWGCKANVLKPKAVRRKDFDDDKACSGFHAGYADDDRAYEIYAPQLDKIVTSVHVIFNEVIPNPTDEYYREFQRLKIVTAEGPARDPATYQYLVGFDHLDDEDGLTYRVTRVEALKGYIVAYRRLVTPRASDTREELVPVHIADICRMTDDLVQSRKASAATPDQESRPASSTSEPPSQRSSRNMQLDEDTGPTRRVRVNTEGVLQSSPGRYCSIFLSGRR